VPGHGEVGGKPLRTNNPLEKTNEREAFSPFAYFWIRWRKEKSSYRGKKEIKHKRGEKEGGVT